MFSSKLKSLCSLINVKNSSNCFTPLLSSVYFGSVSNPVPLLNGHFRLNFVKNQQSDLKNVNKFRGFDNDYLERKFYEKLQRTFGLSDQISKEITYYCRSIFDTHFSDENCIEETISLIAHHFSTEDIIYNPQVFAIHPRTLKQRIEILNELGFERLLITQIDSMFHLQLHETPFAMKTMGLYSMEMNPIECLMRQIQCPNFIKDLTKRDVGRYDFVQFIKIRQIFLSHYLSWKLGYKPEEALKIITKKSSRISNSSLSNLSKVIDLLIAEKFPPKTILTSSFLVGSDYKNTELLLKNYRVLAGCEFKDLCVKYPRLLDTKYVTLKNNLAVLKAFGITDDQINKGILGLTLSTETLRKRLTLFNQIDDFKMFKDHPRILRIIVKLKSALDRLEELKSIGCSSITIDQLTGSKQYFDRVIHQHEHPNNKNGVIFYLTRFLQVDLSLIINIGLHPYCNRITVSNANKIAEYFISQNISKQQLINGIYVVLYDYELVKQQYQEMMMMDELQPFETEWKQNPYILQLLLYYIEKKYSFTGNGVFITQHLHKFTFQLNEDNKKPSLKVVDKFC